jgi:hypothetical protein
MGGSDDIEMFSDVFSSGFMIKCGDYDIWVCEVHIRKMVRPYVAVAVQPETFKWFLFSFPAEISVIIMGLLILSNFDCS